MKILVTGGAGFIGGNFVHFMLKEHPQDDILCVGRTDIRRQHGDACAGDGQSAFQVYQGGYC